METLLRDIWSLEFATPSATIGLDDDFLSLGGDSCSAMKAARRCRLAGLPVSTVDILSESTISRLARSIETKRVGAADADGRETDTHPHNDESFTLSLHAFKVPPGVDPDNIAYVVPCTPMQEDYYHLFSTNPAPERPGIMTTCYEILFRGGQEPVDPYRAARAWQAIVDRHAIFRTRFVPLAELGVTSCHSGPLRPEAVVQLVMRRWPVDCAVVHIDSDSECEIRQYSAVHTANMLYRLKPAACVSIRLFVTPSARVYMNVVLWHIAADFVATGVFQVDFDRFYRGALPDRPAPGFELYVHHLGLTTRRGQAAVESGTRYWIHYLTGAEPCRIRPHHLGVVDRRPTQQSSSPTAYLDPDGKELTCVTNLGRASCRLTVTGPAASYCRKCCVLPSRLLSLAYALTLSKYTGHEEVCISYLVSDRDRDIADIDKILGMMITYFYARVKVVPTARVADLIQRLHADDLAHRRHLIYRPKDVARALGYDKSASDLYGVLPVTNVRFNDRRIDIPQGLELAYRGVVSNLIQELFVSLVVVPEADGEHVNANFTFKRLWFTEESVQTMADTYARIFHAIASGTCETVRDVMSRI
ncbi:Nonribosomal peptide synthetase easA [Colletotrichum gloeosporioides]|uniref:Nonribosomal peptide synthetase easA n=1 Tax=Colletotrichum gloeosporioides TaxID=474922 RepID=A0A8H4FFH9_COLGL|nr:Nonribosomal peptide synthetase easA [Colletotrichum gloeosporioides]KAF3799851.1 Nonribosomal peptide synthetase easA [Colletotrichum gloeosporioides]